MKKNEFDVPVDLLVALRMHGRLMRTKLSPIYWAKIRMASKKKKFNLDKDITGKG